MWRDTAVLHNVSIKRQPRLIYEPQKYELPIHLLCVYSLFTYFALVTIILQLHKGLPVNRDYTARPQHSRCQCVYQLSLFPLILPALPLRGLIPLSLCK